MTLSEDKSYEDLSFNDDYYLTTDSIEEYIRISKLKIRDIEILIFVSDNCPFCIDQLFAIESVRPKIPKKCRIKILHLNNGENKNFLKNLGVKVVPTTILIKHMEYTIQMGFQSKEILSREINKVEEYCINCVSRGRFVNHKHRCKLHNERYYEKDNCSDFM